MQDTTEYLIKDGAFWRRRVYHEHLGEQNELLKNLAKPVPITARNVARVLGGPMDVVCAPLFRAAIVTIPHIPFSSYWMPLTENPRILVPCYDAKGTLELRISEPWSPRLASFRILLAIRFNNQNVIQSVYLWLHDLDQNELRRIPYPNNYGGDGRMCMGPDFDSAARGVGMVNSDTLNNVLTTIQHFSSSVLSNHLVVEETAQLFRRHLDGGWIQYGQDDIRRLCPVISISWLLDSGLFN